jgi:hypothetical protein
MAIIIAGWKKGKWDQTRVASQFGFALKGHGFSRAVTAAKSIAALAAGGNASFILIHYLGF